ncbi:MAG TPA: hypothetical protein VJL90_08180 [Pseudorhodoplanes sp.]|nr:hypothetical protein [Pseudorhodoplanes sp.]
MLMRILTEFDRFPEEKDLVGSLVVGYGEIEFSLMSCVGLVCMDGDMNRAARVLFRVPGEAARINVADALLKPALMTVKLDGQWSNAVGALRHCKTIRNQYAHCHWTAFEGLEFANLDEAAGSSEGVAMVKIRRIDLTLLRQQMGYFEYAVTWLYHLYGEYEKRTGKLPTQYVDAPKVVDPPPLYNPPASVAPTSTEAGPAS